MVEGHQCHRVAHAHRRLLVGKAFEATSPNGRFVDGAAAISGKVMNRIEVHGKNLFYFFGGSQRHGSADTVSKVGGNGDSKDGGNEGREEGSSEGGAEGDGVVMHVHFGMSGAFRTAALPGPQPTQTTRLALRNTGAGLVAHLSAMTVQHGPLSLYKEKITKLGPDPLREDADAELLWEKVTRSKKPIGLVLMDQSMMAGIGNIYRAEVLFKCALHPEQPANSLAREQFDRLWAHSVAALQRGFLTGSILTVEPEDARRLGKPWTRRYIYNHKQCGKCLGPVRTWDMAARTVYACETCQPLRLGEGEKLPPARLAALAAAGVARKFVSHCAPDDGADVLTSKLTVSELRAELGALSGDSRLPLPAESARGGKDAKAAAAVEEEVVEVTTVMKAEGKVEKKEGEHVNNEEEEEASEDVDDGLARAFMPRAAKKAGSAAVLSTAPPTTPARAAPPPAVSSPPPAPATPPLLAALRAELRARGLPSTGGRAVLLQRLSTAGAGAQGGAAVAHGAKGFAAQGEKGSTASGVERRVVADGSATSGEGGEGGGGREGLASVPARIRPGTLWLGEMTSARDAAVEKLLAGESRAVEHVALADDNTTPLALAAIAAAAAPPAVGGGGGMAIAAAAPKGVASDAVAAAGVGTARLPALPSVALRKPGRQPGTASRKRTAVVVGDASLAEGEAEDGAEDGAPRRGARKRAVPARLRDLEGNAEGQLQGENKGPWAAAGEKRLARAVAAHPSAASTGRVNVKVKGDGQDNVGRLAEARAAQAGLQGEVDKVQGRESATAQGVQKLVKRKRVLPSVAKRPKVTGRAL